MPQHLLLDIKPWSWDLTLEGETSGRTASVPPRIAACPCFTQLHLAHASNCCLSRRCHPSNLIPCKSQCMLIRSFSEKYMAIPHTEISVQEQVYSRNVPLPESERCAAWCLEQVLSPYLPCPVSTQVLTVSVIHQAAHCPPACSPPSPPSLTQSTRMDNHSGVMEEKKGIPCVQDPQTVMKCIVSISEPGAGPEILHF